jgi:hypothetical protein
MNKCVLTLLLLAGSAVQAKVCETVNMNVLPLPDPVVTTSLGFNDLNTKYGTTDLIGLVAVRPIIRVEGCTVTVGYEQPQLYVAAEVARDECFRAHVMEHEQEHVAIYRRHLMTLEASIRADVGNSDDLASVVTRRHLEVRKEHQAHDADVASENARACNRRLRRLLPI